MGDLTKNLSRHEFACKCGCGFDTVDFELVNALQEITEDFEAYIVIHSGCRCKTHNANCGGAKKSKHLIGRAADFSLFKLGKKTKIAPDLIYNKLNEKYFTQIGIGVYNEWNHFDIRSGTKVKWKG